MERLEVYGAYGEWAEEVARQRAWGGALDWKWCALNILFLYTYSGEVFTGLWE